MTTQELAIKFSNDKYSTKKEVANDMKTPLVDNIWNNIKEYRNNFNVCLSLKHITNENYTICLTPNINQKLNNVERKLMNINFNCLKLSLTKSDIFYKKAAFENILKRFAENYNIKIDDYEIQKIISNDISNLRPELIVVSNYFNCLNLVNKYSYENLDLKTFEAFNSKMLFNENVGFRTNEIENELAKVMINKIYVGVPVNNIEKSFNNLIEFINDDNVNVIIKAIGVIYYIYYMRPYDAYSEDLAFYGAKTVLAHNGLEYAGSLNLESILLDDKEEFKKYFIETQKEKDLTYFLNFCLSKFDKIIDEANLFINNAKSKVISNELYSSDNKTNDLVPDLNELDELNESNEIKSSNLLKEESSNVNFSKNIAIDNISTGLNEQEAQKLERHLLEMEPMLTRGQAYFYARHCTLNMNYTISQYKKDVGCAYETARSSMDNLVRLGYYKKELLKNKFVYIPIKRR